jgi:hypothetical protein
VVNFAFDPTRLMSLKKFWALYAPPLDGQGFVACSLNETAAQLYVR